MKFQLSTVILALFAATSLATPLEHRFSSVDVVVANVDVSTIIVPTPSPITGLSQEELSSSLKLAGFTTTTPNDGFHAVTGRSTAVPDQLLVCSNTNCGNCGSYVLSTITPGVCFSQSNFFLSFSIHQDSNAGLPFVLGVGANCGSFFDIPT